MTMVVRPNTPTIPHNSHTTPNSILATRPQGVIIGIQEEPAEMTLKRLDDIAKVKSFL
jgi:hypothetical protein